MTLAVRRVTLTPLPYVAQLPHPSQVRRLIVNYDDAEHCYPGEAPAPRIAYGVEFPDGRIVLWHINGYIDWHLNLSTLYVCYVAHGNCHVEFLDRRE